MSESSEQARVAELTHCPDCDEPVVWTTFAPAPTHDREEK